MCSDDPNVDENTRLRNRIAELESLVRELRGALSSPSPAPSRRRRLLPFLFCGATPSLRTCPRPAGKPHPKWAEPNFCDGDATEKWHSRSSRRLQFPKGTRADGRPDDGSAGRPSSIKTEHGDPQQQQQQQAALYRFTPSPEGGAQQQYALYGRHGAGAGVYSPTDDASCYASSPSLAYGEPRGGGEHYYDHTPHHHASHHGHHHGHAQGNGYAACPCLTNPAAGNALIGLTQQLQSTLAVLRQLPEHAAARQQAACAITRRVVELNDIMQ